VDFYELDLGEDLSHAVVGTVIAGTEMAELFVYDGDVSYQTEVYQKPIKDTGGAASAILVTPQHGHTRARQTIAVGLYEAMKSFVVK
jgi:hypothetical protein